MTEKEHPFAGAFFAMYAKKAPVEVSFVVSEGSLPHDG